MKKIFDSIDFCATFLLRFFAKLIHIDLTEEAEDNFSQFIKFGVVGLSNTLISYIIYAVTLLLLKRVKLSHSTDYMFAQVLSFVLSVAWSFYWNNRYVFSGHENKNRNIFVALLRTYISYSFTGLFLNSVLLILWVEYIGISEFVAPILNLIINVPLNFIINKFWAFGTSKRVN